MESNKQPAIHMDSPHASDQITNPIWFNILALPKIGSHTVISKSALMVSIHELKLATLNCD